MSPLIWVLSVTEAASLDVVPVLNDFDCHFFFAVEVQIPIQPC